MGGVLLKGESLVVQVHYSLKLAISSVPYDEQVWIWYQDTPIYSEHCIFVQNRVLLRNSKERLILRNDLELYPVTGTKSAHFKFYTGQVG
jgi:hypothetical protein